MATGLVQRAAAPESETDNFPPSLTRLLDVDNIEQQQLYNRVAIKYIPPEFYRFFSQMLS